MSVELLPDLPDTAHGIKSLNPTRIQCDGCGRIDTAAPGHGLAITVILSSIQFLGRRFGDHRRMCTDCWKKEGIS